MAVVDDCDRRVVGAAAAGRAAERQEGGGGRGVEPERGGDRERARAGRTISAGFQKTKT